MIITPESIVRFAKMLCAAEHSAGTVENYVRHVRAFMCWLDGNVVTKEAVSRWKQALCAQGLRACSVNGKLVALNRFLEFLGIGDCRVQLLRVQRSVFRDDSRELTRREYERLLSVARKHNKERLALVMETICATGIRVSELKHITVKALVRGRADIALKGKIRTILLPRKLCKKLDAYAGKAGIVEGELFLSKSGYSLSRKQIWADMKALCRLAGVMPSKVYPHNLRHLFARMFYKNSKDIVTLSDILGHTSINTTRLYLVSTGVEHRRQMERLALIE